MLEEKNAGASTSHQTTKKRNHGIIGFVYAIAALMIISLSACVTGGNEASKKESNPRYPVKLNGKWGFVDKKGNEVIPCKYNAVWAFSEELTVVGINKSYDNKLWGYIDKSGNEVIPCIYYSAEAFSEGLALVCKQSGTSWTYYFIDKTGNKVLEGFESAGSFREGLASVKKRNGWFYIDKTGAEIIALQKNYSGDRFSDGLAYISSAFSQDGFIDKTGKVVFNVKYREVHSFSEGLACAYKDAVNVTFIDTTGEKLPADKYFYLAEDFHEGLAAVSSKGSKHGFIDKTGNLVIPEKFRKTWYSHFSDGLCPIQMEGSDKYGYIDKNGNEAIPLKYEAADNFQNGLAAVKSGNKWGYINKSGKVVIDFKYDNAGYSNSNWQ